MAIEFVIQKIGDNGLRTSSYDVRMRQNAAYRRAELVIGRDENPQAVAAAQVDALWERGEAINAEWFVAAQQRQLAPVYKMIQMAVQQMMLTTGDLNAMNAAGAQVIASNDVVAAMWLAYRTALAQGGVLSALELHHAMMTFAVVGRQAAGE